MLVKVSVSFVALLISLHAFASSQIVSEFEIHLPRQFQQHLINRSWETLMDREFQGKWLFPDQVLYADGVPIKFKSVTLKLRTSLEKPHLHDLKSEMELTSRDLQAEIILGEVSLDHIFSQSIGGVLGRFRAQAICRNVVLKLSPGRGALSLLWGGAGVQDVDFQWAPGGWTFDDVKCEGLEDFSGLLLTEIERINRDPQFFMKDKKDVLKAYFQSYLNNYSKHILERKKITTWRSDMEMHLQIQDYKDLGQEGLQLRGVFVIDFLNLSSQGSTTLKLDSNFNQRSSRGTLRLPAGFLKDFLLKTYTATSWPYRISSEKVPGFNKLMRSRLIQFFVWPELLRFPKSALFLFDFYPDKNLNLEDKGLAFDVQTLIEARMWAPRKDQYVPFMAFREPFQSRVDISINAGQLNLSFNSRLNFSRGVIRSYIMQGLGARSVSARLPRIPLLEGVSVQIEGASVSDKGELLLALSP